MNAHRMLDDFWNAAHSADKLSPCVLADKDVRIETVDGKDVLVIEVPRAKRQFRPVYINGNPAKGTFRRDHTGDYLCNASEVQAMYRDSSEGSVDARVHENLAIGILSTETVTSYRRNYDLHHTSGSWTKLDAEDFLLRIGAAAIGEDGGVHPTSAGLLMFGDEWRIVAEFPHFFLDYRQETSLEARWQDRVTSQGGEWSGNVYDFYQRVYEKMRQALKVSFKLDGDGKRLDETTAHGALREAIANCLVNADYNERRGVVLLWREDGLKLSNPGGFRVSIEDAYIGGNSDPRNETMMKMLALVNVGERAGSGIPNMIQSWMDAGYQKPVLSEQINPERSTVFLPLSEVFADNRRKESAERIGEKRTTKKEASKAAITAYLEKSGSSAPSAIGSAIGLGASRTNDLLRELRKEGLVKAEGSTRDRLYSLATPNASHASGLEKNSGIKSDGF